MLLQSLADLYHRLEDDDERYGIAPRGFSPQKITFRVVLRLDGSLFAIEDARDHSGARPRPRRMIVPGSGKPSGPGINPNFLWDQSRYMLGYKPKDSNPSRTEECFLAFRDRHLALRGEIGCEEFEAVCVFLEGWEPSEGPTHEILEEAAKTGFGIFTILGRPTEVHEVPEIREWWSAREANQPSDAPVSQCLITGDRGPVARLHEKIKGVAGAQSSGAPLVGFNDPAYESYGLSQSFNAPVSEKAAFRYTSALNALLDGPARDLHRRVIGDLTLVFWTERATPQEDYLLALITDGEAQAVEQVGQNPTTLQSISAFMDRLRVGMFSPGSVHREADDANFVLLGLSPNAGRISQRFLVRDSLGRLEANLAAHFRHIGLEPQPPRGKWRGDPEFPSVRLILRETARESKDIPPLLEGALLRSIVTGERYPRALFSAVMRRIRADRAVDYLRCSVLKGYLVRNLNRELPMTLDLTRSDPPYLLGRLFAALEKTQQDALGSKLNSTIRDSYYSSASATPGVVFPRLLRTYQHHLSKLEGGMRVNRERLIQDILGEAREFPGSLSLEDQGVFAIGYYHQRKDFFTPKSDRISTD